MPAPTGLTPTQERLRSANLDDLIWLVENIQAVTDKPICLDSANPKALEIAIKVVKQTPMINSISAEPHRLTGVLPLVAQYKTPAIALAMDEKGIAKTKEDRLSVIRRLLGETRKLGIATISSISIRWQ